MVQLKRDGHGHLALDQTFTGVKSINGKTVSIKLAGASAGPHGQIRFAFKHILDKSKTHANDDDKLTRRVWHRVDKGGTKGGNPSPGPKSGGLGRNAKYAKALGWNADLTKMKNTAIYLSLMDLDTVLAQMANAMAYHPWGAKTEDTVEIEFSRPCIKTADASGHITGPVDTCKIEVYKVGADAFELGHLMS